MLQIVIPASETFNELTNEFVTIKECKLQLEHSLISIAKWEAIYNTPFLSKKEKTPEQIVEYIKCMTLTQSVLDHVYMQLTSANFESISKYIDAPMTATTFSNNRPGPQNREVMTAELIYYYMIALNIPTEFQKWHLNRLLTLIRVCSIKNEKPKKRSTNEILTRNAALNAARRKQLNTTG